MTKKSTAVTKKEDQLPAGFEDLASDTEQFREDLGKDDISIPFLQILQSLSPQCTRGHAEFIKGAETSMLFNTVTKELYSTRDDDDNPVAAEFLLQPIAYKRSFIEWVTRANGGGFVQEYDVPTGLSAQTLRNDINLDIIQPGSPVGTVGNQLNDTHTHFVNMIFPNGSIRPAVMTMTSTQIKSSKDWNSMIQEVRFKGKEVPRFFSTWNVTTRMKTNDQGSWYVWQIERHGDVTSLEVGAEAYGAAKRFATSIKDGEVAADHAKADAAANPDVGAKAGSGSGSADEEVPF